MTNINEQPMYCLHPKMEKGSEPSRLCPNCHQKFQCSIREALIRIDAALPTDNFGEADLSRVTEVYSVPDDPYYCKSCEEEFRDWSAVVSHVLRGTVQ
ncbi:MULTISPECIES: hypothetical protein [Kitasatospora]|uniref:hypothetical protein n=1 Tax=Kitasatospora TaxID=2063 RepID=UPI0011D210FB|nr:MULTISPECIES: hypothetical protein [Kitasatospora]